MFEEAEIITLASQLNETIKGKTIQRGQLGNSPHKFVWYNCKHDEFEALTQGKTIGTVTGKGKWLFVPLEPDYMLVFGEFGGKLFFHPANSKLPKKYHLLIEFEDGSSLTETTQMWGAMELYKKGEEQERTYIKEMRPTSTDAAFTLDYFNNLIDEQIEGPSRSVKSLLTADQLTPGIGNSTAQDILFNAKLNPRHPIKDLTKAQREELYNAITNTVYQMIEQGGRYDEYTLYGERGGYVRLMDKNAVGKPCPNCGHEVKKTQYLGGSCYFCSNCQQ